MPSRRVERSRRLCALSATLFALLGVTAVAAQRASLFIAHASTRPAIDGRLTESVWRAAPAASLFARVDEGTQAAAQTTVRLLWDAETLYVGFRCEEPELASAKGLTEQHDDPRLEHDDCVELLLAANEDQPPFRLVVNILGGVYDASGAGKASEWDANALVRTSVGEVAWEGEIALPWDAVSGVGETGQRWLFNFGRHRAQGDERSSWAGTRSELTDTREFGVLVLAESTPVLTWLALGDEFGDLPGGGIARGEIYNPRGVAAEVVLLANAVDALGNVVALREPVTVRPYDVRPFRLAYGEKLTAPVAVRLEASGPGGEPRFFRSPRLPLRPRFLLPRIQSLRARWEKAAAAGDAPAALSEALSQLQELERDVRAPVDATAKRWAALDERLRELAKLPLRQQADTLATAGPKPTRVQAPGELVRQPPGGDYVLIPVTPWAPVFPDTRPNFEDAGRPLALFACPGEWEPTSFVISSVSALEEVSVVVSDLTGEVGTLPASEVDVRVVKCWPQVRGEAGGKRVTQTVPELLVKDDRELLAGEAPEVRQTGPATTRVPAGASKQVWLTVHVPGDATAGAYEGEVVVTPANQEPQRLPLRLRVLPLTLPKPGQWLVMSYRATLDPNGAKPRRDVAAVETELRDILAHGFTHATSVEQGDRLSELLSLRERLGMRGIMPWCANLTRPDQVRQLRSQAARRPGLTLLFAPRDLRYLPDSPAVAKHAAAVREGNGASMAEVRLGQQNSQGTVDLPVYSVTDPGFVPYLKSLLRGGNPHRPRELYTWDCTREDPLRNRLFAGFYLFKTGFRGLLAQHYQQLPGDAPFEEAAAGPRYPLTTYPTASGPLPTVQWEGAREGIDDLRYATALSEALRATSVAEDHPARKAAVACLARLLATVQADHVLFLKECRPKLLQELRWDCAAALLGLKRAASPSAPVPE